VHPRAMCDKHGPDVADVGPGGDWVCLMSWADPDVPMPLEGYGKFELNVHSNDCFTASGPSKLVGFLTLTDTTGKEVANPAFEFDGCFDPHGDNAATGVEFPSLVSITTTVLSPDANGRAMLQLNCGAGIAGCSGTIEATAGDVRLGTLTYDLTEQSTTVLTIPEPIPGSADAVTVQLEVASGVGPPGPVTLPVLRP